MDQSDCKTSETKKGYHVNDDYRLLVMIGLMLLFMGWLFSGIYIGWGFVPFGFYYLHRAWRARKGADTYHCSACAGTIGDKKLPKCPRCGIDLE